MAIWQIFHQFGQQLECDEELMQRIVMQWGFP
jgi:hypothetical protein